MPNHTPKKPTDEQLAWIKRSWIIDPIEGTVISRKTGKLVGSKHNDGHLVSAILGRQIYIHHIIWWKYYGTWPVMQLDHRDRNGVNNRIDNLFEVTHSVQMLNRTVPSNRVTGVQQESANSFSVRTSIEGKTKYLGSYPTLEEASAVYQKSTQQRIQMV